VGEGGRRQDWEMGERRAGGAGLRVNKDRSGSGWEWIGMRVDRDGSG